jgi:PIN domain nuclease of toxin-antitoxin system
VSEIVLDASALLALVRGEPGAEVVASYLGRAAVSSVNLSETYGRLLREAFRPHEFRRDLEALNFEIHSFDANQAFAAGRMESATRPFGLGLGDRACLALAQNLGLPAMTADRQWMKVDVGVEVKLIR